MLRGWLIGGGLSVTGLLLAACGATPQTAATDVAAHEVSMAATRIAEATTQAVTAATQAIANGLAQPIPGFEGQRIIKDTPEYTFIQEPNGVQIVVMKKKPDDQ